MPFFFNIIRRGGEGEIYELSRIKESYFFAGIDKNHDNLAALNDDLADHPEISGQEFQTSRKIVKLLESYGYLTEYPYAGLETAFRAISGSNDHTLQDCHYDRI